MMLAFDNVGVYWNINAMLHAAGFVVGSCVKKPVYKLGTCQPLKKSEKDLA